MKKYRIVIMLMIVIIVSIGNINADIINTTPEFNGKVIDTTTGEAIEKAIISVSWMEYGQRMMGGQDSFHGMTIITGKDGVYKIPEHRSFHLFTKFTNLQINVSHPLYAQVRDMNLPWAIWRKDEQYIRYEGTRQSNNTIHYDIKLVGVEEAIRRGWEKVKAGENPGNVMPRITGGWTASWFKELKEKYGVRYDLEKIWNKWIEIGKTNGKDLYEIMKIDNDLKKLKEGIDQLIKEGY